MLDFADVTEWESWLTAHHHTEGEAWLRIAKRGSGIATIDISAALDGALCFGWVDGHRRGLDEVSFLQRYSPRRDSSAWSRINVAKVDVLLAAGRMRPAGLAAVEVARSNGRWHAAYEPQSTATTPPDLADVLEADPRAGTAYRRLSRSAQYALILPILKAHTPRARTTALERAIAQLTRGDG